MLDCLCGSVDRGCSGEKVRWIQGVVPWWMAGSRVFGSARRDQMGQDLREAGRHRLGVCCNSSARKEMRGGDYGCVLLRSGGDPLDGTNHLFIHLHLPGDHRIWPPENVTISFEPREMNLFNSVLARRTQYTQKIQF